MNPKHIKTTEYSKDDDGNTVIESKSYHDQLSHHVVELEKQVKSSFETLKLDVDHALKHFIEDGSPKLVLTLDYARRGQPRIIKRWVTVKENYNKR